MIFILFTSSNREGCATEYFSSAPPPACLGYAQCLGIALSNLSPQPLQHQEQRPQPVQHMRWSTVGLQTLSLLPAALPNYAAYSYSQVGRKMVCWVSDAMPRILIALITWLAPPSNHRLRTLMPHLTHREMQIQHSHRTH